MPAPKGHEIWGNPVKPKSYTPEGYWAGALLYFEECKKNIWFKNEAIKSGQDTGKIIQIPIQTPYTIQGLCAHLNISVQTFYNYESAEGYETYFDVSKAIRNIIEKNQLEGAIINVYNANIIGRLLGLVDKTSTEHSGEIKTPQNDLSKLTTETLKKVEEELSKKDEDNS